ncbi:conserved hypothetical protein [gamma proteobacterium HTCC5015]|nr:conserved hypothetical protein [gamma proteobacterium HTCC5015]
MNDRIYQALIALLGLGFATVFAVLVIPPLIELGDPIAAAAGGFVNPFASGYSTDVIMCWCVLSVWVVYEAKAVGVRHGWVALALGVVPGVATGFAVYLLLRHRQTQTVLGANHE